MAVLFANNAATTLAAGITSGATSITVATGQGALFPSITGTDFFYGTLIDSSNNIEIVRVTARTSDTMTVVRGQEGTTARAYATGDKFELRVTAAGMNNKLDKDGGSMTGVLNTSSDINLTTNTASLRFRDAGGSTPSFISQGDNNFVFYNTDAAGTNRAIWSSLSRSGTSSMQVAVPLDVTGLATLSSLTVSGTITTNATTQAINLGTVMTSGILTMGGTSTTGNMVLGRSTATQTTNIQAGATTSGNVKTINIGTGGLSGSTTNITIGSTNGTTITLNGTVSGSYAITNAIIGINTINADNTLTDTGTISANSPGFRGVPQNSQTTAYTLALADQGKHISITTGGVTIPANASVAFPVGATITIFNNSASTQTLTITTDTLRQAGTTNTGSRTIAAYGLATCVKVASTTWVVSGNVT